MNTRKTGCKLVEERLAGWMDGRKNREKKRPCTDHSDCCKDRTVVWPTGVTTKVGR